MGYCGNSNGFPFTPAQRLERERDRDEIIGWSTLGYTCKSNGAPEEGGPPLKLKRFIYL